MKSTYLLSALLTLCSLSACTKEDQPQAIRNDLSGSWAGDYQTQQAGNCTWTGVSVTATATFQVINSTVTATVNQTAGTTTVPAEFTGTINGSTVSLSKTNNAICNGTPRTYVSRFDGTISGNTLTLISQDTICPVQGCIFRRILKLTRQ